VVRERPKGNLRQPCAPRCVRCTAHFGVARIARTDKRSQGNPPTPRSLRGAGWVQPQRCSRRAAESPGPPSGIGSVSRRVWGVLVTLSSRGAEPNHRWRCIRSHRDAYSSPGPCAGRKDAEARSPTVGNNTRGPPAALPRDRCSPARANARSTNCTLKQRVGRAERWGGSLRGRRSALCAARKRTLHLREGVRHDRKVTGATRP